LAEVVGHGEHERPVFRFPRRPVAFFKASDDVRHFVKQNLGHGIELDLRVDLDYRLASVIRPDSTAPATLHVVNEMNIHFQVWMAGANHFIHSA
jgi:hypothetical protein